MKERLASQLTSVHNVVMLAGLLGVGLTGSMGSKPAPTSDTLAQRVHAGKVADLWLTQWPHLAGGDGPRCAGSVF